jgi:rhodanese-related sulfurtransferase
VSAGWEEAHMSDDLRISVDELRRRMESGEQFTFVDTRNPQAWAESSEKLPDAIRLLVNALDQNISRLPKDKPIVIYCT